MSDVNGNFFYDQVGEAIAMQEVDLPIPSILHESIKDTLFKEVKIDGSEETQQVIDTIKERSVKKLLPSDVVLRMFNKEVKLQEFEKAVRSERNFFSLIFTKCEKSHPTLYPINFQSNDWYKLESNEQTDTLKYWITDTTITKLDTLQLAVEYLKTDDQENFVKSVDTLNITLSYKFLQ